MRPLYYREINFSSDKFNRQGGTRSHPIFYLNDSPIVGARYVGLKNISLPTSFLNLPQDEFLQVEYSYYGVGGGPYTFGIEVPAGQYDAETMGAMLSKLWLASNGFADNDFLQGPQTLPLKTFVLNQITSGKDVNRLEHKFTGNVGGTFEWRYDFSLSPVTARLLGFPSGDTYSSITANEDALLGPPSRFLEPQSLWIRSTLSNGILHFGNSFTGKSNSRCADVLAKVVYNPADVPFNSIAVFETNPTPSSENLFSFSCYTPISDFDMWLSTHPTSLYPNGREIDLQGQVWSGTLCLLCEVPS